MHSYRSLSKLKCICSDVFFFTYSNIWIHFYTFTHLNVFMKNVFTHSDMVIHSYKYLWSYFEPIITSSVKGKTQCILLMPIYSRSYFEIKWDNYLTYPLYLTLPHPSTPVEVFPRVPFNSHLPWCSGLMKHFQLLNSSS